MLRLWVMSRMQIMLKEISLRRDPTALIVHYSRVGLETLAIDHYLVARRLLQQVVALPGLLNKVRLATLQINGFRVPHYLVSESIF